MPPLKIKPRPGRKRPGKYHNVKTADGYDSLAERARGQALKIMEKTGMISGLRRQVKYVLVPAQYGECGKNLRGKPVRVLIERELSYMADFVYRDELTGEEIVEDVKGFRTEVYKIKRKLMLYVYGIRIKEITV